MVFLILYLYSFFISAGNSIFKFFFSGVFERYYSGLLHLSYCSYNYHLYIHGCKEISGTVTLTLSRGENLFRANFIDF